MLKICAWLVLFELSDFLNVDDDELNEMPDDHDPHDEEEARFIENTGWSSRTRYMHAMKKCIGYNRDSKL